MEDGLLSLKWNNHRSTFFHILSEVRGKQTYTDATLACEGKFFPVHKLVMSTCSDYFGEIFEKTPCKNPVVVLKDIKKSDLEALLDYMYIGEVDVRQSELAGLIKAAECLRIKGLAVPDEDPTKAHKKGPPVPDPPHSPPAKRKRRDSPSPPLPRGSSQSSSSAAAAAPVPSQAPPPSASVPESHVPSQPMPPPAAPSQEAGRARQDGPPSGHLHHPQLRGAPEGLRSPPGDSSHGAGASPRAPDPSILPVQMIKVEVDEGGEGGGAGRESHGGERGEEGSEMDDNEEDGSNDFPEYTAHTGEIEKEEHDQVDSYGTDQLPGPSGLQGGPPVLAWGEEGEAGFPHNLFGGDDAAAQQAYDGWAGGRGQKGEEGRAYTSERMGGGGGYKEEEEEDYEYEEEVPGGGGGETLRRFARVGRDIVGGRADEGAAAGGEGYEGIGVGYIRLGAGGGGEALPILEPVAGFEPGTDREPATTQLTCPRCGRSYTHKSTLRRHLRAHEDDRPFGCDICDYRALQKSDLRRHMRTHTGERPYGCPHCEHRASQSGDLDRHIVSVHRDLSHACVMCTHLAPSRASMASHLRKKHA